MKRLRARLELLSPDEIEQIHRGSLYLLEHIGMRVPNLKVCRLAERLGANVDQQTMTVYFPRPAVEELLKELQRVKCGEAKEVPVLRGNVSTQLFRVNYLTGERRNGTMQDVMDGIALLQGLDNFPLANAVVVPSDVPSSVSDILSYQAIYKYSRKDGGTYVLTPGSAKYVIEMARVMGRRPEYLLNTLSPLSFAENSLEIALLFGEAGLDLGMAPMVMGGSTAPISIAGLLTLQNAEALGSLFIIYAITGRFANYVAAAHTNDIRHNMICSFGSPNQAIIGVGSAQMAEYYGLSSGSNSGLTDSVRPDFQCGFEKTLSASFSMLAGTSAIGGQGLVGSDQGISFAQLVLDNEWIDAFNYATCGIEVDEDSIGLETIEEVGIGGNFLGEEHTVEYMRDSSWQSKIFDRDNFSSLMAEERNPLLMADAYARELIEKHREKDPVVAPNIAQALDELAQQAVEELTK